MVILTNKNFKKFQKILKKLLKILNKQLKKETKYTLAIWYESIFGYGMTTTWLELKNNQLSKRYFISFDFDCRIIEHDWEEIKKEMQTKLSHFIFTKLNYTIKF